LRKEGEYDFQIFFFRQFRLALNSRSSCLTLQSARITDRHHHPSFTLLFKMPSFTKKCQTCKETENYDPYTQRKRQYKERQKQSIETSEEFPMFCL
jgi:hypothetical protein